MLLMNRNRKERKIFKIKMIYYLLVIDNELGTLGDITY